jgi:hypothetical protein
MPSLLQQFHDDLKAFRRSLKAEPNKLIGKKALRDRAELLGRRWSAEIIPDLSERYALPSETLQKYSTAAARLIKLSGPNNSRASYLITLESLIKPMRDELILPIQSGATTKAPSAFEAFVANLKDPAESTCKATVPQSRGYPGLVRGHRPNSSQDRAARLRPLQRHFCANGDAAERAIQEVQSDAERQQSQRTARGL